jgi:hypothetical protein
MKKYKVNIESAQRQCRGSAEMLTQYWVSPYPGGSEKYCSSASPASSEVATESGLLARESPTALLPSDNSAPLGTDASVVETHVGGGAIPAGSIDSTGAGITPVEGSKAAGKRRAVGDGKQGEKRSRR